MDTGDVTKSINHDVGRTDAPQWNSFCRS